MAFYSRIYVPASILAHFSMASAVGELVGGLNAARGPR